MADIPGTDDPDVLQGTPNDDVITGLGGNDILSGGDGRDELYGGDGTDTLYGNDASYFHEIDKVLSGGAGDDVIYFGDGNVGTGNPVPVTLIDGGSSTDIVNISSGFAFTIDLSDPANPHTFYSHAAFNGQPEQQPFIGVTLVNVEQLNYSGNSRNEADDITGGALTDNLSGGYGDDILRGAGGDDTLSGGQEGRDTLIGAAGNDTLLANLGDKLVDGGDDTDHLYYSAFSFTGTAPTGITFSLADAAGDHDLLGTTVRNVEAVSIFNSRGDDVVIGGALADELYADLGNDQFHGGGGNDLAYGEDGNDSLFGDAGADLLYGGVGNDIVHGGADADRLFGDGGDDRIVGGAGADVLTGCTGSDVFVFAPGDVGLAYADRDKITDFQVGVDHLDLTAFEGVAITLEHSAVYDRVKIDLDGDHKTDALIQVATVGGMALTVDDLIV